MILMLMLWAEYAVNVKDACAHFDRQVDDLSDHCISFVPDVGVGGGAVDAGGTAP
jgi:hypothetical protein